MKRKWFCLLVTFISALFFGGSALAEAPQTYTDDFGIEFVLIPAGSFLMGSPPDDDDADDDEQPQRRVTISRPFYLGKYEVTQAQWETAMGNNPSEFKGVDNPVEMVSWDDAQKFIRKLNQNAGHNRYRLPTEAEWEYAARAGSGSAYNFGDDKAELGRYAWYKDNSGESAHSVGQKEPNAWGLYDMHGNVWEWVADWYGDYRNGATADPAGPASGSFRMLRGGSWRHGAASCRSALRFNFTPGIRYDSLGFRLALSLE